MFRTARIKVIRYQVLGSAEDRLSTLCFSPLGLFAGLSMAAGADSARGKLAAALQLPPGDDEALRAAGALARSYARPRAASPSPGRPPSGANATGPGSDRSSNG